MVPGVNETCEYTGTENLLHTSMVMTSNLHACSGCYPNTGFFCTPNYESSYINDYTQWHNYGIEWSATKITFYLDGIPYRTQINDNKFDPTNIILNFALNNHDFAQNTNFGNLPAGGSADMLVDYVKYYKLNNACSTIPTVCGYNFATHTNTVKQNIVFGDNTCPITVPTDHPYFFRAADGILINGDFTVPEGAVIYFDANPCN